MNSQKHPVHSHDPSHPLPPHASLLKKEGRLKTHHKHALRITAWLGVLALVVGGFASARTSFFGLFEKDVDDHTLTGLVSESLVDCDPTQEDCFSSADEREIPPNCDVTGNCSSSPSAQTSEETEDCDVTGNCTPEKTEDCQDPTGNCLPEPQPPQNRFEAGKTALPECDDPTGNCPELNSRDCDATGKNCDSEPSRPNSLENCDVTGNCPEEKGGDCQDPTGNCLPQSEPPQTRFEARKSTLPECDDPTGNCPEPSAQDCDATGNHCDLPFDSRPSAPEEVIDSPLSPFSPPFVEPPVFLEDWKASPQMPEAEEQTDSPDEILASADEEEQIEESVLADFQSSMGMSPVSSIHQIPLQFCLNYDPQRSLTFTDTQENRSIEILKNTYVKNRDGSRTYILSGDFSGKDASSSRATFSPEREMTRVDFAKMLMTANCLEFLSSEELLQTNRLNGQDMPGFYDLPKKTSLKQGGQDGFFANVLYNATFYGLMDGNTKNEIQGKRPIYASETIKVLVRLRQFLEGNALTQDANTGNWYDRFYEAATEEGLKLKTLYKAGDVPISRQTAAEELLKVTLLRELYSPDAQQEVEAFLYR